MTVNTRCAYVKTLFLENHNKKKTVIVGTFWVFSFHRIAAGDVHAPQVVLLLPREHLGDVCHHAISHTPSQLF